MERNRARVFIKWDRSDWREKQRIGLCKDEKNVPGISRKETGKKKDRGQKKNGPQTSWPNKKDSVKEKKIKTKKKKTTNRSGEEHGVSKIEGGQLGRVGKFSLRES